ncbi:hypothetical protein HID58_023988 [Brassica napus]|uniref:Uncharacterized protein n=1 Tax=Brassica napus TaxID=3708 RepID=A0ABQ8D3N7_BRANA|nr:hypothetical protein HID58_023988 [Brassica napus]
MKFGKELSSQMVPEWQQAYMSYDYLKNLLKEIIKLKHKTNPPPPPHQAVSSEGLSRKMTLYRAFSGLVQTPGKKRQSSGQTNPSLKTDIEEGYAPILVNKGGHGLETTFLMTAEEGGEYELVFFRRLDDEFNRVEKFYKEKVEEVVNDAVMLNKQMDALIAFRVKVENPVGWGWEERTVEMTRLASDVATSTAAIAASTPARTGNMKPRAQSRLEAIHEGGSSRADQSQEDENHGDSRRSILSKMAAGRPAPIEVLDHIKINNTKETPRSTIKGVLHSSSNEEIIFNRHNLREVEEKLKVAFVEFYQKLRLLKSYSFLNVLAFSKILKKYDKITSRKASKPYMKMVDNSYLGSSDELMKLIQRVEATFIKHFANGNRRTGMNILRPQMKRERHRLTFSTGFSAGCVFSLIVALVSIIRARNIFQKDGYEGYMKTMFPLYSLFGFIVLHMTMYAIDIYYWKRYRVNYAFIFGFKQGTELGYRQVLFVGFSIGAFALLCVLGNLDMQANPRTKSFQALTELLPLFLLGAMFTVLILPLNILYRSSRFFFLTCLFHCLAAPLYKVTLPDFFLGDQLTSQVQALRSIQFYICYYGWGDFKQRQDTCKDWQEYKIFLYIVAVIPYLSRLLQCMRRMFEERSLEQGYNGVKYLLTIIAVCLRTAYVFETNKNHKFILKVLAGSASVLAAVFCTYWDFVHDWGLLNRTSKNRWLRDKLLVPHKRVYFIAMILNVVLRFAWLQTVLDFEFKFLHSQTVLAVVACLEIIRRGIWNFFRLENEHLNNVGKYRAFKHNKERFQTRKMKFGKELSSQMVPEWQQAYMSYDYLKKLLKEIIKLKLRTNPPPHTPPHQAVSGKRLSRKMTLYRAFSGLVQTQGRKRQSSGQINPSLETDIEEGNAPILVNKTSNGLETMFLMTAEEGGEYELIFFRRLDDEFNRIEKFYKEKVEEVMNDAIMLNKQMDALIAFRVKVENPIGWGWEERTVEMTRLASNVATSTAAIAASTPSKTRTAKARMEPIHEGGGSRTADQPEEDEDHGDERRSSLSKAAAGRPAPIEVLDHIKINNTKETPRSTIKGVIHSSNHEEIKFTRRNLKEVEEKLKVAFVQFYQKLRLLKSYSFLNVLAFSKILKKYDKITSRNASKPYMKMVDNSYLGSSDELMKLIQRVEATFIKHFANGNRRKGMKILRPLMKRERHRLTFFTGFSAGCMFSLIVALVAIIRARNIFQEEGYKDYMNSVFPLYSLFGFIVLHMIMYAIDIYYWKRYRVNYAFIFGFKQGTELDYRQVLFVGFSIGAFALLCVLGNLDMQADPRTKSYQALTELLPLFLLGAMLLVLVLPLNILYRSSRFFFLTCLFHFLAAPLYKVTLPDFFLGDQLTSQVQALRSIQFYICHYGWGDFKQRQNTCGRSEVYNIFIYVVAVIPYLSRLLQCIRRMFEERSLEQGYNGVKYFLTILAVCLRTAYGFDKNKNHKFILKVLAGSASVLAAVFCTYWDFVYDWGLLNRTSKNRWLRDKLLVPHKRVYFIAMILNVVLRFAWLQTVLDFEINFLHTQTVLMVVACLEIIRRGIWNFFRLENEHLNNVGKYRAFKSIPLPFSYDEDDDKDD